MARLYAALHKKTTIIMAPHKMSQPGCGFETPPPTSRTEINSEGELMFQNWVRLTRDAVLLGLETQRVMALRLMKLSRGGRAAETEAMRMVAEKAHALVEAGLTLTRGGSAVTVIRRYRTHERANKRRLLKS